jgi:hypothetical protein
VDAGLFTVRSLPRLMLQRFGPARRRPAVIGTTACCVLFVALMSPVAAAKGAFANLQDLSAESATAEERPALQPCSDLELWLLNPTCSTKRKKHPTRTRLLGLDDPARKIEEWADRMSVTCYIFPSSSLLRYGRPWNHVHSHLRISTGWRPGSPPGD